MLEIFPFRSDRVSRKHSASYDEFHSHFISLQVAAVKGSAPKEQREASSAAWRFRPFSRFSPTSAPKQTLA